MKARAESALSAEGFIAGHASLYGVPDLSGDVVMPGAFAASLRRRGRKGIRMLWQHDPAQPVGLWTRIEEDARGLYVEGHLIDGVARASELRALIASGAVDGLSIGFRTIRARRAASGTRRRRHLLEIDLWEISIVTFPMLGAARIATSGARLSGKAEPLGTGRRRGAPPVRSAPACGRHSLPAPR